MRIRLELTCCFRPYDVWKYRSIYLSIYIVSCNIKCGKHSNTLQWLFCWTYCRKTYATYIILWFNYVILNNILYYWLNLKYFILYIIKCCIIYISLRMCIYIYYYFYYIYILLLLLLLLLLLNIYIYIYYYYIYIIYIYIIIIYCYYYIWLLLLYIYDYIIIIIIIIFFL